MALTNTYNWNHNFPKLAHDTGFSFNTHKPRVVIDWNKIKLIDIEQLIRDRDFATVEDHFHDVVDCGLEWEFDVRILDSGVVKLFRLAQLAVEYQLYCRQYLDRSVAVLRDELSNTMQDLDKLKKELRTKDEEMKKIRKRSKGYKTMVPYVYGNENIANMILKTLSQGPDIAGPKPYSDLQQGYNKCYYCDKVFLNEAFLKSHILRRHPEHANDIQEQMYPIGVDKSSGNINPSNERVETKLYDEINKLKQRLQDTERILSRNSETVDNNQINFHQNNDKDIPHSSNIDNNVNSSPNKSQIKTTELASVDANAVLEKKIEGWKMNEQKRYLEEIETLKKQLSETVGVLREKAVESPVVSRDDQALQYLTSTLQKQEDEIKNLHQQLENKNAAVECTELQLKSQIESQEQTWRERISALEHKHASQVKQLTQRLEEVHRESVKVQQERKSEKSELDELRRRMEKRIGVLEQGKDMREVATEMSPGKKLLTKSDSIDSLPPYTSSILPTSTSRPKSTLQSTHNHLRRQAQRVLSKQLHSETTTLSDSSDDSLELDKTPIKMCRPVKTDESNSKNSAKNKEILKIMNKENIVRHQKCGKNEISPVRKHVNKQNVSKNIYKDEVSKINKSKENIKENVKSLPIFPKKVKSITKKKNSEGRDLINSGGKERRSKSEMDLKRFRERNRREEGSDLSESEIRNHLHRRRVSFDNEDYSSEQRLKRAAIHNEVLSRLQTLGVDLKCHGLTERELIKLETRLQNSRSIQEKKYKPYQKTRSGILLMIEKEIRKKTGNSNKDVEQKIKDSPTAKLVNRLSVVSMFSNVKKKAMSIVKPQSDKMKIEQNQLGEKSASLLNTPSGYETSSPLKKVLNRFSPKRKIEEIPAKTVEAKRKLLANSTARDNVHESDENLSHEEISDSDISTSSVEKMTHFFNRDKKTGIGGYKVVTSAIAHEPTKSIESLIRSPIKVPKGKLNDVATSKKGKSLLRATSAWSTRSEEPDTRVMESDSDDSESVIKARKFFSEENLIHSASSPKGVLKNAPSNLSISSKKKVLFDLEATQMKSVSASPSQSTTEVNRLGLDRTLDADVENRWDVSSIDEIPIKEPSKAPADMFKRSPKIAELTQRIESQLARRPENIQIAGAVQVMPKMDHKSPERGLKTYGIGKSSNENVENYRDGVELGKNGLRTTNVLISGSNTSIGSSVLDDSNDLVNSPTNIPVPAPRYSAKLGSAGKFNKESDLEISDWSIEELLKAK